MKWIYKDKKVEILPENVYGFVYILHLKDDKKYIGKKNVYEEKTLPALKSGEIREGARRIGKNIKGKREYFDIVTKESNWKEYAGSSKDINSEDVIGKEILEFSYSKRQLTYLEVKYQFKFNVLEDENFINKSILNKFFKGNLL